MDGCVGANIFSHVTDFWIQTGFTYHLFFFKGFPQFPLINYGKESYIKFMFLKQIFLSSFHHDFGSYNKLNLTHGCVVIGLVWMLETFLRG